MNFFENYHNFSPSDEQKLNDENIYLLNNFFLNLTKFDEKPLFSKNHTHLHILRHCDAFLDIIFSDFSMKVIFVFCQIFDKVKKAVFCMFDTNYTGLHIFGNFDAFLDLTHTSSLY